MKKTLMMMTAVAMMLIAAPTFAQGCNAGCQLQRLENNPNLRTRANIIAAMEEINNEDQRVVAGTYDPTTGILRLQTQDMVAGADGDLSVRYVEITGFEARDGADGTNGIDGVDGANGTDAVFPQDSFDNMMDRYGYSVAASTALGGLELRTPGEGDFSIGGGIGGILQGGDSFEAVSFGLRYGISNSTTIYGKVATSLDGGSTAWFVGVEALLSGGQF